MKLKLEVGQHVSINGGFGPVEGTISEISSPCIYVETSNWRLRFNNDGEECGPDGTAYDYSNNVMLGPGPWKILRFEDLQTGRDDATETEIGQDVRMQSGDQFKEATVTEITEKYIAVEPVLVGDERKYSIRFHYNGTASTSAAKTAPLSSATPLLSRVRCLQVQRGKKQVRCVTTEA